MRCLALLLLLVPATALAGAPGETPPESPPPAQPEARPRTMWTIGLALRSTSSDPDAHDQLAVLDEYGWNSSTPMLFGLRGDAAFLQAPIVDVGAALTWVRGTYAELPGLLTTEEITGSSVEAGAFARMHWVKPTAHVAAEPRVEIGVARTSANLRGVSDARFAYYTRIGLDFRLGGRRGGTQLSVDYTTVHQTGDHMLELPAGGVTVSLSFYWRNWRAR